MGIGVGYGMRPSGLNVPELKILIAQCCLNDYTKRNANCHVGSDRQFTKDDPEKNLFTAHQYVACWDATEKEFRFPKEKQKVPPKPSVETRPETELRVSEPVVKQVEIPITAAKRRNRKKRVPIISELESSTFGSVPRRRSSRLNLKRILASSTKSDDKASDSPVEMTSNGSDNESTSNSSEKDVSDVPEEHVLRIYAFHYERRGYIQTEYILDKEGDDEYRVEINRKHLEDWRNGIDPYAPEVQVDLPEGQCWYCGGTFLPHGLSCRCSNDVRANRPGPEPRVCTNYWPKQFTYEGERFGHKIATTPVMEEYREKQNQLLFQAWYKKRCME
jgi:hypothetical protein